MTLPAPDQLTLFSETASPPGAPPTPVTPAPALAATDLVPTPAPANLAPGTRWYQVDTPQQRIGFVLKRSRRKSIGLTIHDDGLQVTAPTWVALDQVDQAVRDKAPWILTKLRQLQARRAHLALADTQWCAGGLIPYLGQTIQLQLGHRDHSHHFEGDLFAPHKGQTLFLALPDDADQSRVRDTMHAWLQARATTWFDQRLAHFLQFSAVPMSGWRLSSASTRWGSCNSKGRIMLNWRLIHFAPDIIDYVVAHEVAHLRHLHHGPAFWQEVERLLPNFENARRALRKHPPDTLPLL